MQISLDQVQDEEDNEPEQKYDEKDFEDMEWIPSMILRTRIVDGQRQYLVSWKQLITDTYPTHPKILARISKSRRRSNDSVSGFEFVISWNQTFEVEDNLPKDFILKYKEKKRIKD